MILELEVPRPEASTYLKAMDRARWAFPLVGVAAARFETEARAEPAVASSGIAGDAVDGVRLALAGVAPIPWRLDSPTDLDRATPLPGTAYKVELARPLLKRALAAVS